MHQGDSDLKDEIKEYKPKKVIISDEHINLYLDSENYLRKFKELCDEFGEVKTIIIYLRRQDEFRLAMLSEGVKRNNSMVVDPTYILPQYPDLPYRFNYLKIVDNFASVFGKNKIVIRIYDRELLISHDICTDFMAATGLNVNYDKSQQIVKNRSLDARIIIHIANLFDFYKKLNLKTSLLKILLWMFVKSSIEGKKFGWVLIGMLASCASLRILIMSFGENI